MAREKKRPHRFSFIGSALAREREGENWATTTERRRKFPFGLTY
jgi:hypothetical protein